MGKSADSFEPLEVLIAAGTVRGTCLLKRGEVVYETFPYSAARLVKVCRVVEGLTKEFQDQGRSVDQMAFGYEGGNLLAISVNHYRLVIMHLMNDEIDFLANIARNCLEDCIAADKEAGEEVTEPVAVSKVPEISEPVAARDMVSIDTVPVTLAKDRHIDSTARIEETTKVAVTSPPVPGAPPVPETESSEELSENMSLGM